MAKLRFGIGLLLLIMVTIIGSNFYINDFIPTAVEGATTKYYKIILVDSIGGTYKTTSYKAGTYTLPVYTRISFGAVPDVGYVFSNWIIQTNYDGLGSDWDKTITSTNNPYSFMSGSTNRLFQVTPVYKPVVVITYSLTVQSPVGTGSTSLVPGTYTYNSGTQVSITATPSSGWLFKNWEINGITSSSSLTTKITLTSNTSIQPIFTEKPIDPPPDPSTHLPFIETILSKSQNTLIDGMDSEWSSIYGTLEYNTNDYVIAPASLKGTPRSSGPERLSFQKTFDVPINLLNNNIGFWIRTTGTIPSDLTFSLELYDNSGLSSKIRKWTYANGGSNLVGSNDGWSHHFVMSTVGFGSDTGLDMTNISKIIFRFSSNTSSNWTFSIDDLKAYPNQVLFPNGAVIMTFDGPYPMQFEWAEPKLSQYGYHAVLATAQDTGDSNLRLRLGELYNKGWDICVYSRMFTMTSPIVHKSEAEILGFALAQRDWLNSMGFTRSSQFLQCNRHLLDVYTEHVLEPYFYIIKGQHWLQSPIIQFPSLAFTGVSRSFETDMYNLQTAYEQKGTFIWFNHLKEFGGINYTQEEFNAFVDKVHSLGMEVVTYSELLDRYSTYLN